MDDKVGEGDENYASESSLQPGSKHMVSTTETDVVHIGNIRRQTL